MSDLVNELFPEREFYRHDISCKSRLSDSIYERVLELRDTDEMAAHLMAWPDHVVMRKKHDPKSGTYFVRIFESAIQLTDKEVSIYESWYPIDRIILLVEVSRKGILLSDYVAGKAVKPAATLFS